MSATPDSIVLIHGLWMGPRSCDKWAEHYESESRGYKGARARLSRDPVRWPSVVTSIRFGSRPCRRR